MSRPRSTLLCLLFALHIACSGDQGLAPPDLSKQSAAIDVQTQRFEHIGRVMDDDLREVRALRSAFFTTPAAAYSSPFPLDLFKITALNCFNQPVADDPPAPLSLPSMDSEGALTESAITCRSDLVDECLSRVGEVAPDRLDLAMEQLERVDRFRRTRATFRARAIKVDVILRQARDRLARARADLRQQRKQIVSQEADYRGESFAEATRRLQAYDARLDANAAAIDALEETSKTWSVRLQREVDRFTLALVALRLER
ncbi:MAG: hypothetical protein AAGI01_00465 [Myxococcota bacterium]